MLFLQFMLYSSSFVGTLKNKIPGTAPEFCQLKIKAALTILKFRTKHDDNLSIFNCSTVSPRFLFIFHAGLRRLGSNDLRNSSYKEKTIFGPCFQTIFPFLMTMMEPRVKDLVFPINTPWQDLSQANNN